MYSAAYQMLHRLTLTNMNCIKGKYLPLAFVLILIQSCGEEFERTQLDPPTVTFTDIAGNTINSLLANGQELAVINIDLDRLPFSQEQVTITTTHGRLFEISEVDFTANNQQLVITPFSKSLSALLMAGTEITDEVQIVVQVGNQTTKALIEFIVDNSVTPPAITFTDLNGNSIISLIANGDDKAIVNVDLGRPPFAQEAVILTTSHGNLFPFTSTDFTTGTQSLTLMPTAQTFEVLLQSATQPEDNVLITATAAEMVGSSTLLFAFDDAGCPNTLEITSNQDTVSIAANETAAITAALTLLPGISNEVINVDFSVSHSSFGSVSPATTPYDGSDVSVIFTPTAAGLAIVTVKATDTREGCAVRNANLTVVVED